MMLTLSSEAFFAYVTFIVQEIAAPHVAFAQPGAAQIIVVVCGLHHGSSTSVPGMVSQATTSLFCFLASARRASSSDAEDACALEETAGPELFACGFTPAKGK